MKSWKRELIFCEEEWIPYPKPVPSNWNRKCFNCRKDFTSGLDIPMENGQGFYSPYFCPFCGAKMRMVYPKNKTTFIEISYENVA